MPVAWDQFEAVDEPAVDWANFEPDLSPEQESKKADLQKQMSRARLGGKVAKAGEIAADVAQRVAYTASQIEPITAAHRAIHAFDPNPQPPISSEMAQQAIRFASPFAPPAEGSAMQGAEQFGGELISGFSEPEVAAAALTGKVESQTGRAAISTRPDSWQRRGGEPTASGANPGRGYQGWSERGFECWRCSGHREGIAAAEGTRHSSFEG